MRVLHALQAWQAAAQGERQLNIATMSKALLLLLLADPVPVPAAMWKRSGLATTSTHIPPPAPSLCAVAAVEPDPPDPCAAAEGLQDYSVGLHVAAIFILLVVSLVGALLPVALHVSSGRPGVTTGIRLGTFFGERLSRAQFKAACRRVRTGRLLNPLGMARQALC